MFQWNDVGNLKHCIQEKACENFECKMWAILLRPQFVKPMLHEWWCVWSGSLIRQSCILICLLQWGIESFMKQVLLLFRFSGNITLLLFKLWRRDHYKILHRSQQLCCLQLLPFVKMPPWSNGQKYIVHVLCTECYFHLIWIVWKKSSEIEACHLVVVIWTTILMHASV